jgi:Cu(I)/Ag(I) efflux system membrane protein CusA/SilA
MIPGAAGVSPSRVQGKPYLNVKGGSSAHGALRTQRRMCSTPWRVAIGGKNVSVTIEGRERFPIQVRLRAWRAR